MNILGEFNYILDMPNAFISKFHRPALTVDVCIIREIGFGDYEVLLIERGGPPYKGCWALPGGYVNTDKELILDAAYREMYEEVLNNYNVGSLPIAKNQLRFIGFYDSLKRHPSDRVITFGYTVVVPSSIEFKAGDDAKALKWFPVSDLPGEAFDHHSIIRDAVSSVKRKNYV